MSQPQTPRPTGPPTDVQSPAAASTPTPTDAPAGVPGDAAVDTSTDVPAVVPTDAPTAAGVVPPGAGRPAAPPARSRGRQTAVDMVRSMVVILAFVGVVLLLAPQPDRVDQPQVSDGEAAVALEGAAALLDATPLLLSPGDGPEPDAEVPAASVVPLGPGWRLDYARTEQTDDVDTWRVGVLSPQQRRIDLEQALDPGEEWLSRGEAGEPGLPEPVEVGGLTWTVQERGDGDVSWTWVDPAGGPGALTTAVSASSDSDDLQAVVDAVSVALAR